MTAIKIKSNLSSYSSKPCGHSRHHGACPDCQRAQLARWRDQLAQVGFVGGSDKRL